jgi:hypothetical protein
MKIAVGVAEQETMEGRLVSVKNLQISERTAMYALLDKHFDGVKRDVFDRDLDLKNWVVLLTSSVANGTELKGFSTFVVYEVEFAGDVASVIYSGDTIMDPSAWSSSVLSRTWIAAINILRQEYPRGKLYWLLLCSGYRTYRFLPTFAQEFYPYQGSDTPKQVQEFMGFLARERFGSDYDDATGVVRFSHPHTLRGDLKGIAEHRLQDEHIRFFDRVNLGHHQGDNLVCLTEISVENLTKAGQRMWMANSVPVVL